MFYFYVPSNVKYEIINSKYTNSNSKKQSAAVYSREVLGIIEINVINNTIESSNLENQYGIRLK